MTNNNSFIIFLIFLILFLNININIKKYFLILKLGTKSEESFIISVFIRKNLLYQKNIL